VEASGAGSGGSLGVSDRVVRAAGGVPWRRRGEKLEVLLVHRPKYDDWSFPKGKCNAREKDEECALREIAEETNLRVTLGPEVATVSYESKGKPKRVRYWAVAPAGADDALPANEVDDLAWLELAEASARLTYDRDRDVLGSFAERV
jgi:8-oxo-dGTP pyrophosphatase MutT (NUDIX family)